MTREIDDETLSQYFDGELPPEKREMVRLVLESSEIDRARLARLERLSGLIRMAAEDVGATVDSDSLFGRIQAGVKEQSAAGFGQPFEVLDGARMSVAPVERWKIAVPLASAFAVAAGVLLVVYAGQRADNGPQPPVAEAPRSVIEAPPGSEVEVVDFGSNTGTVFAVKGEAGEPLAVVWLSDEGSEEL